MKGREISRGLSCLCSVAGAPVTQQIEMEIAKDYRPSDAKNHDGGEHGGDDERGDDRLRGAYISMKRRSRIRLTRKQKTQTPSQSSAQQPHTRQMASRRIGAYPRDSD